MNVNEHFRLSYGAIPAPSVRWISWGLCRSVLLPGDQGLITDSPVIRAAGGQGTYGPVACTLPSLS